MEKTRMKVIYEDLGNNEDNSEHEDDSAQIACIKSIWYLIVSLLLWFNLVTTPFLMLYPELSDI